MKKDSYYFPHDYHARNDRKLIKVFNKLGMEGIGIFWCLVEMLYEENGKILLSETHFIASEFKISEILLNQIILEFDLFKNNKKHFWSESVKRRLSKRLAKTSKAKESARIRWGNANALRTQSDGNAIKEIKEKKGEEIKERDIPEINSTLWTSVVKNFFNDFNWIEKFCRDKNIEQRFLESKMRFFINDIELREDFKDLKEVKNHFTNWYNKNEKDVKKFQPVLNGAPPLRKANVS